MSQTPSPLLAPMLLPPDIAEQAETAGVKKAAMAFRPMLLLSILAGAFIALGGNFFTIIIAGGAELPWGVAKTLGGVAFSLGLILVVIGGAELFTGNNLLVIAVASRKATIASLARNWAIVYLGNFIGSIATALLILLSGQYAFGDYAVGRTAIAIAQHKCSLAPTEAFFLGVYCNVLVCLAVWLSFASRSVSGKILAIVFPITAFIAGGFEHCVANMYLIPLGIFVKEWGSIPEVGAIAASAVTWGNFFFRNLIPVTFGNIVGGSVMVGAFYWMIYRQPTVAPRPHAAAVAAEPVQAELVEDTTPAAQADLTTMR